MVLGCFKKTLKVEDLFAVFQSGLNLEAASVFIFLFNLRVFICVTVKTIFGAC